ncbi:sialic acid-binding Ig-like lectin 11 isoform X1 [Equus asinus]|uniref:sialic acid-binding Ig-like lectin 11 isoform X1 n=2 Tax=Equus asinus TaxID=9793 RepID=UPI0038F60CA6
MFLLLLPPLLWAGSLQENPRVEIQVPESVTVQEGLCILVSCTVSSVGVGLNDPAPAYGSWFQKRFSAPKDVLVATNNPARTGKAKTKFPFLLSGDPKTNNCSLSIAGAKKGDGGLYYFQLERGGDLRNTHKSVLVPVTVRALTQTPDIHIDRPLESGCRSHLTCSVPGACFQPTPPIVSWTGAALGAPGLDLRAYNSWEISLTPRPQDHGTNLTCRVTFPRAGVSTEGTLTLSVSYAPRDLTISLFRGNCTELKYPGNGSSLTIPEGESLRLVCVADSNPPATLSWVKGNQTLSPLQASRPGLLELPRVESEHEGEFICQAQHPRGSLRVSLHLSVHYPPQLLGPSCSWEDEGLHCGCSSRAQPAPSLRWRLGERLLEGNSSNASFIITSSSSGPWANSSLSLIEGLSSGLRVSCEATNVHGARSMTVLLLPGKPKLGEGFVLGAFGGAGVAGLLSLCTCVLFLIVKTCRKAAPEAAAGEDAPSRLGPISPADQYECLPGSSLDRLPPAVATPGVGEEELHYASLTFCELRPREPRDQEATSTTEYCEVKIRK